MAGHNDDQQYDFTHAQRGVAITINMDFENGRCPPRPTAKLDEEHMQTVFERLQFEVRSYMNLDKDEIIDILKEGVAPACYLSQLITKFAEEDHTNRDCFALAIGSHGCNEEEEDGNQTIMTDTIEANDKSFSLREITEIFSEKNCSDLAGKPKLFFIQACRGDKMAENVTLDEPDFCLPPVTRIHDIPLGRDFLLAYATIPGHLSMKRRGQGSWFIIALRIIILQNYLREDLLTMLGLVNNYVVRNFYAKSAIQEYNNKRVIPWIASMLTKDVNFKQK